jgi:hypothetical protein
MLLVWAGTEYVNKCMGDVRIFTKTSVRNHFYWQNMNVFSYWLPGKDSKMGPSGQDSQDRTARTGQPGWSCQEGMLGPDSQGIHERTAKTDQPGQDIQAKTARTELPGKNS